MGDENINVNEVSGKMDYDKIIEEFGVECLSKQLRPLEKSVNSKLPGAQLYRRGIVFAHRDFGTIANSIMNKKKFAVVSGFNPSAPLHFGNLLFVNQVLFLQSLGGEVFIPISNDETYVFKKVDDLDKATQTAVDVVIPTLIALGLKPKKTHIFISSKDTRIYELAVKLSTKFTFSTMKAVFGFSNETNPGQIFYGMVQSAHILYPQLNDFGGPKPVVVPIGIDQDPYMRIVRDAAEKIGMIKPSSTYHKFIPSILGHDAKMSGSKPETTISLTDPPEIARRKIMKAFSGGAATLEEHKKHGGNPDVDTACIYLTYLFEPDDKKLAHIIDGFRSGALTSGDVKTILADKVEKFLKNHQKKMKGARKKVGSFLTHDL